MSLSPALSTVAKVGEFLIEHYDLVEDIADFITSGGSKEALKKLIRSGKVAVSDAAMREELFGAPTEPER